MGEASSEGRSQRDLLQRFASPEKSEVVVGDGEEPDEVELSLGLSLGGRFGVDKSSKRLVRSSSVAGSIPPAGTPAVYRTASLPVETEEQWRKRKELQSLRRMEAKRRRSEKQRSSTPAAARDGVAAGELEGSAGFDLREKQHFATSNQLGSTAAPPFGIPSWAVAAAGRLVPPTSSLGSPESRGGSSSGNSEPESKPAPGSSSYDEARSPVSGNQDSVRASCTNLRSPKPKVGIGAMGDMPSVFTKGDGPDGRRVDGILYKYGKGEEVRIMCVCHGSFLSPADFVKHAGGGEVANPLRRIVINPYASSSL